MLFYVILLCLVLGFNVVELFILKSKSIFNAVERCLVSLLAESNSNNLNQLEIVKSEMLKFVNNLIVRGPPITVIV